MTTPRLAARTAGGKVRRRMTGTVLTLRRHVPSAGKRENPLRHYFDHNGGFQIDKWEHYFDVYHRHLSRFRRRPVTVLEFGVFKGGSLQMWRSYFGRRARIIGVDIDPDCRRYAGRQREVVIGDQEDRAFLRDLVRRFGPFDVVVEDGGHTMGQQIATFEEVWPAVVDGGVMIVEDLHTSYWSDYGGGLQDPATFIEYSKRLVDQMNAWHAPPGAGLDVDNFTRSVAGMHDYDSLIVFDKGSRRPPTSRTTGVLRPADAKPPPDRRTGTSSAS